MSVPSIATGPVRQPFSDSLIKYLISILFLFLLALLAGCDRPTAPAPEAPPAFAGSAACGECHASQFDLWQASHHALAMQHARPDTVLGNFSDQEFRYYGVTSKIFMRDGEYLVLTDNADGEYEEFTVRYTFGVAPLQQYLVELSDGHVQALPFAWDSRRSDEGGQRWFHLYPDEFIGHDDPLHWTGRLQNWNYMCAECHSTKLEKNYDLETDSFATTWAEISVGCEACHGPGSRHIARAREGLRGGLGVDLDDNGRAVWQMNTDTGFAERSELPLRPPQQPEACGRCHSRRSPASAKHEFGRPLHDTHMPALLEPHLYFPDGQILDEVYVYGSFIQSRMYRAGVTCSNCHDPHSARLRTDGVESSVCSTCHLPDVFASGTHHRHAATDVQCVDCHMPSRTYMGVDERRDHSFRIPRPDLTLSTGAPNACNGCHTDRGAEWAQRAMDAWYGSDREAHYAEAIDAGRRGVADANARLQGVIANDEYPGIARATALSLLRPPYSPAIIADLRRNLSNPDSLVRAAALSALSDAPPGVVVEWGSGLLEDSVRSVRIEAARAVSPYQASLPAGRIPAFRRANAERMAAQLAVAERPEAHLNLGNAYLEAGDADSARAEFLQALRLEPRAATARVNLADLHAQAGRIADAEKLLRDGIDLAAEAAVLHHALGLILVRDGRQEAALPELEAAANLAPDNARFVYVYAVALNSLDRGSQAVDVLRDAARRFPADFDIHFAMATILRDRGDADQAREVAARLVQQYPFVPGAQDLQRSLQ